MIVKDFKIGIIGGGKVGGLLAKYCIKHRRLAWIVTNNQDLLADVDSDLRSSFGIYNQINDLTYLPEVIIFAVKDDNYKEKIENLRNCFTNKLSEKYIFHVSGTLNKNILYNLENLGATIAACHPFQTFYYPELKLLENVPWGIDCKKENYEEFGKIIEFFAGKPIILNEFTLERKVLYHLTAVITSNYLTALISYANEIAKLSGINGSEFIPVILRQTAENCIRALDENVMPMTGPIARGDINTVISQLNHLKINEQLMSQFKSLTQFALEMAFNNNFIDEDKYKLFLNQIDENS